MVLVNRESFSEHLTTPRDPKIEEKKWKNTPAISRVNWCDLDWFMFCSVCGNADTAKISR
jgi:hypothetical protein